MAVGMSCMRCCQAEADARSAAVSGHLQAAVGHSHATLEVLTGVAPISSQHSCLSLPLSLPTVCDPKLFPLLLLPHQVQHKTPAQQSSSTVTIQVTPVLGCSGSFLWLTGRLPLTNPR